jgi:hypothetical protein
MHGQFQFKYGRHIRTVKRMRPGSWLATAMRHDCVVLCQCVRDNDSTHRTHGLHGGHDGDSDGGGGRHLHRVSGTLPARRTPSGSVMVSVYRHQCWAKVPLAASVKPSPLRARPLLANVPLLLPLAKTIQAGSQRPPDPG